MTAPRIDSYRFGQIVVDGRTYTRDLIICPDHVTSPWVREEGHLVSPADLWDVMEAQPQVLVIGQGTFGRMDVASETRQLLEGAGIQVIAEPTSRAWETYNRLCKTQQVVAALHLTC